jgi:hypothetical protein
LHLAQRLYQHYASWHRPDPTEPARCLCDHPVLLLAHHPVVLASLDLPVLRLGKSFTKVSTLLPNTDICIPTEARKACLRHRCMGRGLLHSKVDMPFRHTRPRSRWERLPLSHLYLRDGVNTLVSGRSSWLFRSLSDGNDS